MTLEELKEQKALLINRIEDALQQFYAATASLNCDVCGSFDTQKRVVATNFAGEVFWERVPKVIIKPIEL